MKALPIKLWRNTVPAMPRDWPHYAMILDMHLAGQSYKAIACQLGLTKQRVQQIIRLAKYTLARRVFKGLPKYLYQWDQDRGCYVAED